MRLDVTSRVSIPPLVAGCLLRRCGGAKVVWFPACQMHESLSDAYLAAREASEQHAELLAVLADCQAALDRDTEQQELRQRVRAVLHRIGAA